MHVHIYVAGYVCLHSDTSLSEVVPLSAVSHYLISFSSGNHFLIYLNIIDLTLDIWCIEGATSFKAVPVFLFCLLIALHS